MFLQDPAESLPHGTGDAADCIQSAIGLPCAFPHGLAARSLQTSSSLLWWPYLHADYATAAAAMDLEGLQATLAMALNDPPPP